MNEQLKQLEPAHKFLELKPERSLLCVVLGVDVGASFGDLTIQCVAIGTDKPWLLDLMFNEVDVHILESAIARLRELEVVEPRAAKRGEAGPRLR